MVFGRRLTILAGAVALVLGILSLALGGCTREVPTERAEDAGLSLCRRFADLHNAHDAGAEALLGPAVTVPADAVTPEEAELIDVDTFLRGDGLRVLEVRHEPTAGRFLLVTKGGAAGEPLRIRSGDKVEPPRQRVMSNPALVVEVRDGKIHGVRAQLFLN